MKSVLTIPLIAPLAALALLLGTWMESAAQLKLFQLFDDGMVVQRDKPARVWGWATPGETVTVSFRGRTEETRVDEHGAWQIALSPTEHGGPFEMTIGNSQERVVIRDILVGDVWVASGQSNMEWTVVDSKDAEAEIRAADDALIRHFKVPHGWSWEPEDNIGDGQWEAAAPAHVGDFSAVAYYFAREIRQHVDVPIGIINTSWGGSRIEPWMSPGSLGLDEAGVRGLKDRDRETQAQILAKLKARIGNLPAVDEGLVDGVAHWADPELDDSGWDEIPVPSIWEAAGYDGLDGIAWYRTSFELTDADARNGIRLGLGMIDDSDVSWVNGHEVGRMELSWNVPREYDMPAGVLRPGRNVVAIRVEDVGFGGGIHGSPELLFVEAGAERRPLGGMWKFKVGAVSVSMDGNRNQVPTVLYHSMIYPLLPYPIAGALWYQGESNASPGDAIAYRNLFTGMIEDWRERWDSGEFPFLFVQLANYMEADGEPRDSDWAVLRESQSAALGVPNTAQAVTIDIGQADDIHPRNKQDVGRRLALAALKLAYGRDVVYSGPVLRNHRIDGSRVVIEFDHVGAGLIAGDNGSVGGFAIAGDDRRFVWADARIDGDRVIVWSDAVEIPVAVRYAWGNNPDRANLYNREGLPTSPFRTDVW